MNLEVEGSFIPEIYHDLGFYKNATLISFCSTPIHIATSLELISNNRHINWNYVYWGNQTNWKIGMNVEYRKYGTRFPDELQNAFFKLGIDSCQRTTNFVFDLNMVRRAWDDLYPLLKRCASIDDLKMLDAKIPGAGAAVANAYTNIFRDRYTSIRWNLRTLKKLLYSYLEVYFATCHLIESRPNDIFLIYNGRYLHEKAVRDACQRRGRKVLMHESTRDKYFLRQEGFHNRLANQRLWSRFWNDSTLSTKEKEKVANEYFEGLRSSESPFFTDKKLLTQHATQAPFVVFFTSNDDEMVGFWDIWRENLGNQFVVIDKLRALIAKQDNLRLVIRIHPNTKNKPWQVRKKWSKLESSDGVEILYAEDKISSIDLVRQSIGVLTFGSTIGLESGFLGKRVAVLCDASYDTFSHVTKCNDWDCVDFWLKSLKEKNTLSNEEKSSVFKRALFVSKAGVPFVYHEISLQHWNSWSPSINSGLVPSERNLLFLFYKIWHKLILQIIRISHIANLNFNYKSTS
jgi:Capsule polysaccharide biosynthesis protein